MKISARNLLSGKVSKIVKGAVNSEVELELTGGERITAVITNASVDALELKQGTDACAIIKANEVIVGKDLGTALLSARNILPGVVEFVEGGAVNSEVTIALAGGAKITASITKHSADALALTQGANVCAIVKSSNVMIGV